MPISIIPFVEPMTEVESTRGAGVASNEMEAAVFCTAAKDGLKFASTSANTSVVNKRRMPGKWIVFIVY